MRSRLPAEAATGKAALPSQTVAPSLLPKMLSLPMATLCSSTLPHLLFPID